MIIILIFLFLIDLNAHANVSNELSGLMEAVRSMDLKCVQLKLEGACMVGPDPGIRISNICIYFQPRIIIFYRMRHRYSRVACVDRKFDGIKSLRICRLIGFLYPAPHRKDERRQDA